jgi:phosphoribosylformimino-5-aminoimidazole carboxamide ribonucleotide (ProFAR) isomerase
MNLEQALLKYGNDIVYLVLRDGTHIEIIDDFPNVNEDEFVEEKFENENYGYNNYIYKEIDQNGTLRGKGLKKNNNA